QVYLAESYEKEGWFDRDGWLIPGWFQGGKFAALGSEARVGDGVPWARDAWARAFNTWQRHGIQNGLYKTPEDLRNLDERAELYRKAYQVAPTGPGPFPAGSLATPELIESYKAHDQLHWYERNRQMTNFAHFYFQAQVEMEEQTIAARKGLFEAEKLRKEGRREQ